MALWVARRHCGAGLKELAIRAGGLDYGSVAVALSRFAHKLEKDQDLRNARDRVERQLYK
jgi:hypothetical protein